MKPVDQTEFGDLGNCYSACLASLFELPIEAVPNFYHGVPEGMNLDRYWWLGVNCWLQNELGYGVLSVGLTDEFPLKAPGIFIVGGTTNRHPERLHAVLYQNGQLLHDPHPDKTGLVRLVEVDLLYPLDPMRFKDVHAV